jgi:small subunit ribosomal protein S9
MQSEKILAIGRRKEAVARVHLVVSGSGKITVNNRSFNEYFPRETDRRAILKPLEITNTLNKCDINARIKGGGISGQTGALVLGIARALAKMDEGLHSPLKKEGLLRRDSRMKERKKYGQKGARKRFQWTKR